MGKLEVRSDGDWKENQERAAIWGYSVVREYSAHWTEPDPTVRIGHIGASASVYVKVTRGVAVLTETVSKRPSFTMPDPLNAIDVEDGPGSYRTTEEILGPFDRMDHAEIDTCLRERIAKILRRHGQEPLFDE